jgi:cellulose biosynthesis protein BcsQ
MIITSIIGTTGGSGASTITAYVSRLLALSKNKVLVVDINPVNEATRLLVPASLTGWLDKINNPGFKIKSCITKTHYPKVDIITTQGQSKHVSNPQQRLLENNFFKHLQQLSRQDYDHIIIDFSAHFSPLVKQAIEISNKVLGVINAKPQGITKAIPFLAMVAQARIGNPLPVVKLILNKVDINNPGSRLVLKQYNHLLVNSVKLPMNINTFKYVKKDNKIMLKLPVLSFKLLSKFINYRTVASDYNENTT